MQNEELEKIKQYLDVNYKENMELGEQILDFLTDNNLKNIFTDIGASMFASMMGAAHIPSSNHSPSEPKEDKTDKDKLLSWIKQQMDENKSFQKLLLEFIKKQGYEEQPSKLYNKIDLDRRVFSRIASIASEQQPDKKTVFKLIIGLELELGDAEDLLGAAGFDFNCHKRFDMILKYCIEHHIYQTVTVDEYLVEFDEKALFSIK